MNRSGPVRLLTDEARHSNHSGNSLAVTRLCSLRMTFHVSLVKPLADPDVDRESAVLECLRIA